MSAIGIGALVHKIHVKQACYCQVLKDAKDKSGSPLSSLEWLEQSKN